MLRVDSTEVPSSRRAEWSWKFRPAFVRRGGRNGVPRAGHLTQRRLVSRSSGGWKSKRKERAGPGPPEASLRGAEGRPLAVSPRGPSCARQCPSVSEWPPLLRTPVTADRGPLPGPRSPVITPLKARLCMQSRSQVSGVELGHADFGARRLAPNGVLPPGERLLSYFLGSSSPCFLGFLSRISVLSRLALRDRPPCLPPRPPSPPAPPAPAPLQCLLLLGAGGGLHGNVHRIPLSFIHLLNALQNSVLGTIVP